MLVAGYALTIGTGALLLMLPAATVPGKSTSWLEALFTATSAVCVTGLVVVDTGTHYSLFGQLVVLGLIQVGGLGFMTMSTLLALIWGRKINLRERLLIKESLNAISLEGVVRLTRYVLLFTLAIEATGALLLASRWVPQLGWKKGLYYGVFHSVAAFCNAGFDLMGPVSGPFSSLTAYREDLVVNLVVASLIVLGGLGFAVLADIYRHRRFSRLSVHSKLVLIVSLFLIAGGGILFFLLERNGVLQGLDGKGKILASLFQVVTPRTAGFNTVDLAQLQEATRFLLVVLMFIGASPGSTGGGIKTTTFATLVLMVWSIITGRQMAAFGRRLPLEAALKSIAIALLAVALVICITFVLTLTERADFLTLLFEAVSAFGTVGLTMGITPFLSTAGKLLIIFTMFAGRVGPLTVALAVWQQEMPLQYRFPEEKIIVG